MTEAVATFGAAVTEFRGSLYTVAALDGQTRRHLQVGLSGQGPLNEPHQFEHHKEGWLCIDEPGSGDPLPHARTLLHLVSVSRG